MTPIMMLAVLAYVAEMAHLARSLTSTIIYLSSAQNKYYLTTSDSLNGLQASIANESALFYITI